MSRETYETIENFPNKKEGRVESDNNRSQKIYHKSNCIVLDAYNANPYSMGKAIAAVNNFNSENKVMILGDMNELGNISGFVSSNLKLTGEEKSLPKPKFKQIDFA